MATDLREQMRGILAPFQGRQVVLIPALQAVQEKFGYLPEAAMEEIGRVAGVSQNVVYGVASFYSQFRFTKPGEHMIKICLGTACHVQGAASLVESLERELHIETGKTTPDGKFSLEEVRCFGSCALAPVIVVDSQVYGNVTTTKTKEILDEFH
ncbi:MAG: NADH-quinone oxidoreductase subunit NuoE [Chloroflexi bacterium]|nr:NADH-quinone oxidoreductase subunit NuoE [Chloroflexota bacterium]